MAGKRFGNAGTLKLQVGATVSEEQDYSLKGRAVFEGDESYLVNKPKRGSAHPKNKNCFLFAGETTWLASRKVRYTADYIGIEQSPTPYFLEFVGSLGDESIETHPNFASVIGGTPDAPLHGAKYDDDGGFVGFPANAPQHLGGISTYHKPSVIVRLSYWQNSIPNPGPLGHVQDPAGIDGLVLPADTFNLLVINFGYRTPNPNKPPYQVTVELLGSGVLGWSPLIYSPV